MIAQLDMFAPLPAARLAPTSFARTWRSNRLFARVMVSKSGQVWCFGYDLWTSQSGEGCPPTPDMSQHQSFEEALAAGMAKLTARCKLSADSQWPDAKDYARLLRIIEQEEPEVHESHQPDDEIQQRWDACVAAGLVGGAE